MKRAVSLLLSAGLLLGLLNACGGLEQPAPSAQSRTVSELAEIALEHSGRRDREGLEVISDDREMLETYLENAYGLEEPWEEAVVIRATGASAFEIAVLRMTDDETAVRANISLMNYIFARQGDFAGYAPAEADMVANGGIMQDGPFAALFICPDPDGADHAVEIALHGEAVSEPESSSVVDSDIWAMDPNYPGRLLFTAPNKDDMSLYDTSAILAAWEKDDPEGLSRYDQDIYDEAEKVLDEVLEPGMSDYEKELAVYGWIVQNVDYDWTHQDQMKSTPRESFTPYGGLVAHTAVCLGYATTFQLLMDLAGVECITVTGASRNSYEDHGWNMVRLNGEWYCVDVTWDANMRELLGSGIQTDWSYFNVTSDYMANTDHQWDYANTPEATAEDQGKG